MNRNPIRVLLIEDNPGDARLIQEMLAEGKGWIGALECVESLAAGLLRITRGGIDVVLLDLGLPDSAGLDTLRRLRAGAPQAPVVVVMSGINDEEVGMQAVQEGAQDYLVKGQVSSGLLIRSIRYAIERNEAEKALLQARDELESQVRERTARLTQAIESLEKENAERKRAEEALRESRLRLDNIVANSPGAIYRCANDPEWTMEFLSAAITRITGYPADDFLNNRVRSFASIIHPDDRRGVAEAVAASLERRDRYDMDYRLMAADGTLRWVHEQGLGVFAPDGRLLCLDGVIFDITAQRRAEESLRESEQRYRLVFENSPVSIWEEDFSGVKSLFDNLKKEGITDIETYFVEHPETVRQCAELARIVDVNQAALALHAAANKNELMANLVNTFTPESFDTFRQEIICLWNGGTEMTRDAVVKTLAGDVRHVTVSFSVCPGYEDTLSKVLVSLTDITERKRAEEALQDSERRLAEAQRIAKIGNWEWDVLHNQLWWSDETFRLFEMNPQAFGATFESFINAVHPDDRERVQTSIRRALQHDPGGWQIDYRISRADGTLRFVHEEAETVFDQDGRPLKRLGTVQDITERKQAEEEIRKLNQELEQRVADRTAQLEVANKELEAFAYSVSHDMRAPLRHIDGFLELLHQRIAGILDAQSQHYLDTIADAARRMGMLIDDLLAFSRMGRHELATMPVDLNGLVREVIRELAPETAGRNIHWQIADLPMVTGDRAMLRIVFVNLIANALKFTRPRARAEVEIGCQPDTGSDVVICVHDNGVGFDMRYADKLFGVFQRLHHADEFEGTGIGLANVRRIISRHGGRTWAEGAVNQGATFYVALPAQRA